jgi:hypothetical protein
VDQGPGESLLAQAIVPDPCFWTPELPFCYSARVEVRRGGRVQEVIERTFGIRPLGCRGQRFLYEGKPWVLRAVACRSCDLTSLAEYRQADAACLAAMPEDEFCQAATREGVLLAADLCDCEQVTLSEIRRLSRHAAVGFIVLGDNVPEGLDPRGAARNVIFVYAAASAGKPVPGWAQAVLVDAEQLPISAGMPVIASRKSAAADTIARRRSLCDVLQRDLAGVSEIAGYLV